MDSHVAQVKADVNRKTAEIQAAKDRKLRRPDELLAQEQAELATAHRRPIVTLEGALIARASIPGLKPGQITSLTCHGFVSAADVAGFELQNTSRHGTKKALLRRRSGELVYVPNIGPKSAQALLAWKQRVQARIAAPPRGSPPEIQARYRALLGQARAEAAGAEKEAQEALADLRTWAATQTGELEFRRRRIQRSRQQAAEPFDHRRIALHSKIGELEPASPDPAATALDSRRVAAEGELVLARAEAAACAHLTMSGFLRALLGR